MDRIKFLEDFVRKYKNLPTRTIAKLFYKQHPEVYKSFESVRGMVQFLRKEHSQIMGKYARQDLIRTEEERKQSLITIPKAFEDLDVFRPYVLTSDISKWLIMSDIHIPFHDEKALEQVIITGTEEGTEGLIILGDLIDYYPLSPFTRDPRYRRMSEEIDMTKSMLEWIFDTLRPKKIVWKLGNHEDRLYRYMCLKAPELLGIENLEFKELFDTEKWGIEIVEAYNIIQYRGGNVDTHKMLTLLHGDEYKSGGYEPVNPARGIFLKALECAIIGHLHMTSENTKRTISDTIITTWSLGCLCSLHPRYRPLNNWNHGFGILEIIRGTKYWKFRNLRILKGVLV